MGVVANRASTTFRTSRPVKDSTWTGRTDRVSLRLRGHRRRPVIEETVPNNLDELRYELAIANRMLAHEGVLDAFGHVSVRHPSHPNRYLLSRSRGPELVESADILEFTLDSEPLVPPTARLYSERVIHGEIYKARPDVTSVCHHHAPAIMPYAIAGIDIVPVFHLGATAGEKVPMWDQRDDFGDTNLLVIEPEEGRSLARALGPNWMVLMRRHGATVAARSLRECVFRSIYSCRNAEFLSQAHALGTPSPLTVNEVRLAGAHNMAPGPIGRAWEYWLVRLEKKGELPPRRAKSVSARPHAASGGKQRKGSKGTAKGRKRR
jgi:HCOMODA/2-hydroxy-3-carboxy-muconic semialdehyde decarboxylase